MAKNLHLVFIASVSWICCAQYFVVEQIVARAWSNPLYSFKNNYISDLGATVCPYSAPLTHVVVCSPLAQIMNVSFIANGLFMIIGAYALSMLLAHTRFTKISLWSLALGAIGLVGVGLFPENINTPIHMGMAIGFFLLSNTALIAFGISMWIEAKTKIYSIYTILSGLIGGTAFIIFVTCALFGLTFVGIGFLERTIGDPFIIWLVVSGLYILATRGRSRSSFSGLAQ